MQERNQFARKVESTQKARKKSQNQDGNFDGKHKFKKIRKQVKMIKQRKDIWEQK